MSYVTKIIKNTLKTEKYVTKMVLEAFKVTKVVTKATADIRFFLFLSAGRS